MDIIPIKKNKVKKDGSEIEVFTIPALSINLSDKVTKKVPHPNGNSTMSFSTLEKAISAIQLAGYHYRDGGRVVLPRAVDTIGLVDVKQPLIALLQDKSSSVVLSAIYALGEINCEEAITPLINLLEKDDNTVRDRTIQSLAKIGLSAVGPLLATINDENWIKRNAAIICLGEISELHPLDPHKILGAIINKLEDPQSVVRSSAAISLAKIYKNTITKSHSG